jgi:hypothetical protein
MANKVNLDALIPREDFEVINPKQQAGTPKPALSYVDLKNNEFFFSALRKPDFQRETSEWSSSKIIEFVESFLNEDVIPSVILWKNQSYMFVIDGAHRLSALAAWINDDYGDGDISKKFYDYVIPDEQINIAVKTRTEINKKLGSFKDHELALVSPNKVKPETMEQARRLGYLSVTVQYVLGDALRAEQSFVKINTNASKIDATEMRVLQTRQKPIGIAARAIARGGKGHQYWSKFTPDKIQQLEQLAKQVNELLFQPKLPRRPLKTLELPVAGEVYAAQSLPLIVEFIEIVNQAMANDMGDDDTDGTKTIACLLRCKKLAEVIDSKEPGSLGLHPAVYFYSPNGQHKLASFLAIASLLIDFEKPDFIRFTRARGNFETLLIQYDYIVQQILRQKRSASAGVPVIKEFYKACIKALANGKTIKQTIKEVIKDKQFGKLTTEHEIVIGIGDFSSSVKSQTFIREALKSALKCPICQGYLHVNAMNVDHIVRAEENGLSTSDNAQITHPYCNTGYKEWLRSHGTS